MRPKRLALVCIGIAVGLVAAEVIVSQMLKAVRAKRDAAYRNVSMIRLKQFGLEMALYEQQFGHFPPRAIFGKDGKPLLSWRVELLPSIGLNDLYIQFHLDEPWNGPHNRQLIGKMPDDFALPGAVDEAATGVTHYVVPVGKGLAFEGDVGFGTSDITDGLANTIMAVEADKAVPWTKPDELDVDLDKPLNGLGSLRSEGFLALFGDDHVQIIPKSVDPKALKALFTRAGGEHVDPQSIP